MAGAKIFFCQAQIYQVAASSLPLSWDAACSDAGQESKHGALDSVLTALWLDLSFSAAWKYIVVLKENSRDIPLSKRKIKCKLLALDH